MFNRYVFTIEENTPIDQDIALDPELLGKVFENLLATYNPETRESARSETGSFYTPREIVEYMADSSLKEYFKQKLLGTDAADIDEKLDALIGYNDGPHNFTAEEKEILIQGIDTVKILDPACGSGAFPMGVLHKLVYILGKLDPGNELWKERQIQKLSAIDDAHLRKQLEEKIEESFKSGELDYGRKLYLIENCVFGVDIQSIAIQISKLRFFISLIADQHSNPEKKNLGILTLPNLETKFIAANTLIGLEKPAGFLSNQKLDAMKSELLEIRHKLFSASTAKEKYRYRVEDKKKREAIEEELSGNGGWSDESVQKIACWDSYNQNSSSGWFDAEWMFGIKEGFDIVIGNPPYVEHKKLKELPTLIKNDYEVYSGTADLSVYFNRLVLYPY
ncbi:MAG: Eco57I restriction-modification methylase domain-containing protein [Treponema sp.]|jgi:hypothetical protein|nr:Eco57I restriction-modification methylase domain-containing protein [Treponema sp.]